MTHSQGALTVSHRKVWMLAGPIILSNISVPLVGAVDTAVVGHLPEPHSIGAVALGALIFSFLYWGFGFLRMGTTGFIAQAYGIDIGVTGYLMVVLTATLASIGTAGVPGVGLIMLAMVLRQVNLPVEGIGLIIGVDRLLDMVRTAVNVTGDASVTCIVAKSEGQLSADVYDRREAP